MGNQKAQWKPVLMLALLAPFCAEYLVGGISIRELVNLPFLMPLYGAAAVLIHEVARRAQRGWPMMLWLGAAFGAFQAGIVDRSMFDLGYEGLELGGPMVGWIDWNVHWSMGFIVNHVICSIAVPIAITEALFDRGGEHRPWLGKTGYWSAVAWLGGGFALMGADARATENYRLTLQQQGFVLVLVALLIAAAYITTNRSPHQRKVPSPSVTWLATSIVLLLFNLLPATWTGLAIGLALIVLSCHTGLRWSTAPGWSEQHRLALVAGVVTFTAPFAFVVGHFVGATDLVSLIGYGVFGVFAAGLVGVAFRVQGREVGKTRRGRQVGMGVREH